MSCRKREERLRKVLQARERAEQREEERKRRIEQKIALFDEKTEKVRANVLEGLLGSTDALLSEVMPHKCALQKKRS